MERLDQGYLHPHPGRGLNPGEHSGKELLQQLTLLLFGISTILYFVAGDPNDYIGMKRERI
jgi:hypothetical protein